MLPGGSTKFLSARLHSRLTFSPLTHGGAQKRIRVEFEARVPTAKGAWPALWMLGKEVSAPCRAVVTQPAQTSAGCLWRLAAGGRGGRDGVGVGVEGCCEK